MRNKNFIVLPSENKMKMAMTLGMPQFDIIEEQFLAAKNRIKEAKSLGTTRLNKDGGGLREMYISM
jgi:hypothetical protein